MSSILDTMCETLPLRTAIFTPGMMESTENFKKEEIEYVVSKISCINATCNHLSS